MKQPFLVGALALFIVYLVSHWAQSSLGFGYALFEDGVALSRIALDFGIWLLVFIISYVTLDSILAWRSPKQKSETTTGSSWTQILMKIKKEDLADEDDRNTN